MGWSLQIKTVCTALKFGNGLSLGIFADSHKQPGGFCGLGWPGSPARPDAKVDQALRRKPIREALNKFEF